MPATEKQLFPHLSPNPQGKRSVSAAVSMSVRSGGPQIYRKSESSLMVIMARWEMRQRSLWNKGSSSATSVERPIAHPKLTTLNLRHWSLNLLVHHQSSQAILTR